MIYTTKQTLALVRQGCNEVCTVVEFRGYTILILMDDSCGAAAELSRTEIRVYDGNDTDVTSQFFGEGVPCDAESLFTVMQNIVAVVPDSED